jgi:hypothetical protein
MGLGETATRSIVDVVARKTMHFWWVMIHAESKVGDTGLGFARSDGLHNRSIEIQADARSRHLIKNPASR